MVGDKKITHVQCFALFSCRPPAIFLEPDSALIILLDSVAGDTDPLAGQKKFSSKDFIYAVVDGYEFTFGTAAAVDFLFR